MESELTRALESSDAEAARRLLERLEVRALEFEPGSVTGTFVARHAASLDAIAHAARSWEAFDRLCERRDDDDWTDDIASFLDATGLIDWGVDHLFVRGRRVAAFSREEWDRRSAQWAEQRGVDPEQVSRWCHIARGFDL